MAYNPLRNLWLKVLAVTLAALLWLTVAGEHIVERSLRVPLEFRNIPPGLEIIGDPPATVDVRVRGSSGVLSRLTPGEVVVVLDLRTARAGSRLFHLRSDEVQAPYGVEVAQVVPPTLSLELEKTSSRTVPVVPAVDGDPAPGFVVGRITADPSTVQIEGPESRLNEVGEATTEPLIVAGATGPVTDTVTVGVADPAVRLSKPQSAKVRIDVVPAPVERVVTGVPVRLRTVTPGLRPSVTPETVRVTIRGGRQALDAVGSDGVDAFVDLAGLGPGRYNLRVRAEPAASFGVTRIDPATVNVLVR
ncbi:MAG: CdaR family protein [Vicinamibacterales bacterium]